MKEREKNQRHGLVWLSVFVLALSSLVGPSLARGAEKYPVQLALSGVKSIYTEPLLKMLMDWPPVHLRAQSDATRADNALTLRCIKTPSQPFYLGFEQRQVISASLSQVAKVLDDIDSYEQFFPDFKDVKVLNRDGNLWLTSWEQKVPVPFVSNVRYETEYLIVQPSPTRRIYRYQLKKSDDLISSDGFIVLDLEAEGRTRYTEYDFYDAHWGMAKVFGKEKLWQENAKGFALSDLAVKVKAENPSFDGDKVRATAKNLMKQQKVDLNCEQSVSAPVLFKASGATSG